MSKRPDELVIRSDVPSLRDPYLLTAQGVAALLQISARQVANLPIPRVRIGRSVRYHQLDVAAYADSLRRE